MALPRRPHPPHHHLGRLGRGLRFGSPHRGRDLRILLRLAGVPRQDILLETRSRNTHENALYTKELLAQHPEIKRTVLITSAFHMRRAEGCFAKVGLQPALFPAGYYSIDRRYTPASLLLPAEEPLRLWGVLLHEMAGYLVYKLLGYS
ncbi:YdcF family protein [Hymenobacter lapidiphilus]|nr:YdcF family protein [Hymenobacter sp. CCM 8763]